jgi:RNA polymerase sigma-70 factor (ECF subfamily)
VSTEREQIRNEILVYRCRQGEAGALAALVEAWERPLFYFIRRLVTEEQDAWDVLQETWLHVFRGIRSLRDPRALPAWLYRIARNRAMSLLRDRYQEQLLRAEQAQECADREEAEFTFEDAAAVHHGLSRLSLPHREALTLFFLDDLTLEEIAAVLQVPIGTVKSRLHYAKQALRQVLEEERVR